MRFVPEPKPFNVDSEADAQFANLPPGYHVAMRDVRPTLDGQGVVEHMLLSDGLSAISVFTAHRKPSAQAFQGFSQIGALNAYGRVVGSVDLTVVGEATSDTVRLHGESRRESCRGRVSPYV